MKNFVTAHEPHKAIAPEEVIAFFRSKTPPLNGTTRRDNKKDNTAPYARDFFIALNKVCKLEDQKDADDEPLVQCVAGGEMYCKMSSKKVQGLVDELVRLHSLTEVSSPFLTFDILPKMSSGEMAFLSMFARLHRFIHDKTKSGDNVMIFLDEAETTLHPEWQRRLVGYFIQFFEVFIPDRNYQLVFASHSPVLLSDIPVGNCCFLKSTEVEEKGVKKRYAESCKFKSTDEVKNTFGANIYDLFHNAFFMDSGAIGEFSSYVIRTHLKSVATQVLQSCGEIKADESLNDKIKLTQALIGDRILVRYFNVLKEQGLI